MMMIAKWLKNNFRTLSIFHDFIVIIAAWLSACWLINKHGGISTEAYQNAISALPVIALIQSVTCWIVGLHRGLWTFVSLSDLGRILNAIVVGTALSLTLLSIKYNEFPLITFPVYGAILITFLSISRIFVRKLNHYRARRNVVENRVLIIGAGAAAEGLVRNLLRDKEFQPVAFIDDNPRKIGKEIHGIPIVGSCSDILKVVTKYHIQHIVIAIPSASAKDIRNMMDYCKNTNCTIRILPGLNALVSGSVNISSPVEISLEHLLERDPVMLDWHRIHTKIRGETVLISGGGGSIGSELCRQLAVLQPELIIVVDTSEYNLFALGEEFSEAFPDVKIVKRLVSVGDEIAIESILSHYCPQIILHAAAYKHVPMLEDQLREAAINNILGTYCLARLALKYSVERFLLVSTDKAVNPTNIMGMTKRAAEIICHSLNGNGTTKFITVRFGNVLGSLGSVVPTFKKQIEKGGPITVTHPEVTRFFMTIHEACQLILQALTLGSGGEIFVLDMGKPIRIRFLAEQLVNLAGKKLGEDIDIKYIGLRPGEKLYEELFYENEVLIETAHEKILKVRAEQPDFHLIKSILDIIEESCTQNRLDKLGETLQAFVPEWKTTESMKEKTQPNNT
jgi:FlaA1/EpsC-like NDP-sugar epimerase